MRPCNPDEIVHSITAEVARAENLAVEDLPPLGSVIDIDALGQILRSSGDDIRVEFVYQDRTITITGDRRITMRDSADDRGPYVSRCNTCGEAEQGVALAAAQDFFAVHADRRHEVEIVRDDGSAPTRGPTTDDRDPGEASEID